MSGPVPRAYRRARVAVGGMFFLNGAVYASVVPRYPDLKAHLGLSNAALGSAVSAYWLGALLVGLLGGVVVGRWGSGRVAWVVTVGASTNLLLIGLAPSWWALAGVLFLAGSFDTVADIAENAQALRVERRYGRSILNSLHGVWSIGAVTGGLTGAAAAGLHVPIRWHLSVAAAVFVLVALVLSRLLLPGPDRAVDTSTSAGIAGAADSIDGRVRSSSRRHLLLAVAGLGIFATLAQAIEDTGATWSTVYLRDELRTAGAVAGLGFVALQTMQTVGRLLGDRIVTRFGDRAVARGGAALAGTGVGIALLIGSPAAAIAGFGVAGLGIATLIPAAMRHADGLPGLRAGVGLTLVGTVSRVGSLGAPPLVGFLADTFSLRIGLLVVPAAAVVLIVLARVLGPAARLGHATPALR